MKVYGSRRTCNLFALDLAGPNYSIMKRDHKKGIQFTLKEHFEIYVVVAKIYKYAKVVDNIYGPVAVILVEGKTKVKRTIFREAKLNTLSGFCRPTANQVYLSSFKSTVRSDIEGYNNIVDLSCSNRVNGFISIIIMNLIHEKLPCLVILVCCTYHSFDSY